MLSRARAGHSRVLAAVLATIVITTGLVSGGVVPAGAAPAAASATLSASAGPMIGEDVVIEVTFDNTDTTDPGYGPSIDLFLPATGADGAGAQIDDGLTFVSASYLGGVVKTTVQTVAACPFTHPVRGGSVPCPSGIEVGDQLVVIELPFGSFAPAQPAATVSVTASVSNLADVGTPLSVVATPWFRYGNDPLDNPASDPVILGASVAAAVTPQVASLRKTYNGPEDETATGPNFPRGYQIAADIADGQTVTSLVLSDRMPASEQYLGIVAPAENPGTIDYLSEPVLGAPRLAPDNVVAVQYGSVTGIAGGSDAVVDFAFFVPDTDASAATVIDPATGDDATAPNEASLLATWDPIDPRDPSTPITIDTAGPEHTLTPKSIAIQKAASPASVLPGATVTYTLAFQISDYFTFDDLVISDVLGDGMALDPTSFTITTTDRTGTTAGAIGVPFIATDVDNACAAGGDAGRTLIDLDVSGALGALGGSGRLVGGLVAGGGFGATTGVVTFQAEVLEDYRCAKGSADLSVDQRDRMTNDVVIDAQVLDNAAFTPTGWRESDGSAAGVVVADATFSKTIYARNGVLGGPFVEFAPGDTITYRLTYDLPGSDVEDLVLTDYLPLPVLSRAELTGPHFAGGPSAAAPPPGVIAFGPEDTFSQAPNNGPTPAVSTDGTSNYLSLDYGTFDGNNTSAATIDVLFTLTVSDEPFADGLYLTNQARASSANSFLEAAADDQIVQFVLTEPSLRIAKGVVASDHAGATFSPSAVGPVAFSTPSGSLTPPRWSGTINSTNLATSPVNSDITTGVDADDLVTFAIVVENTGAGLYGAFDVEIADTVPSGFTVPAAAELNLQVTDGAGTPLAYTALGAGLFDQGIRLDDAVGAGGLAPYDPTSGENIAVVTYNLRLDGPGDPDPVGANETLTNTASVLNYASTEGGPDYTPTDLVDTASVTITDVLLAKSIIATNQAHTTNPNVAIGEIVDYRVTMTVPEGVTTPFTVVDTLDPGLAFHSFTSSSASGALTMTAAGGNWSTAGTSPVVTPANAGQTAAGRIATWSFGTVTNTDTENAVAETITLEYRVVVLNTIGNQNTLPTQLNNSVTAPGSSVSAPNVRVAEPILQIAKSVTPTNADAGDTVTFTLVISHDTVAPGVSNASAFEVSLVDDVEALLPDGFEYVAGSFAHAAGAVPTTISGATSPITASWTTFALTDSSTLTFEARIPDDIDVTAAGGELTNTAQIAWSSLPGDETASSSPYNDFSVERTGDTTDPGGTTNDHRASGSAVVDISNPGVVKTFVGSTESSTSGDDLTIGEIATYELAVTLPEGALSSFSVTDRMPAGLAYVPNSSEVDTTGFGGTLGAMAVNLDPPSGPPGSGDDIVFSFGGTTVDTTAGGDETFTIRFDARVLDVPGNSGDPATVLTNRAAVTVAGETIDSDPVDVTVVEPKPVITKAFEPALAAANDTVRVTLTVENAGTSTSFDTVIEDPIDRDVFTGVITPVTTPAGYDFAVEADAPSGYDTIRYSADGSPASALAPGASVVFEFDLVLEDDVPVPGSVTNTATVTRHTTLPGAAAGERDGPDVDAEATLDFSAPDIAVTKDDGIDLPELVVPGQELTYTVTIANEGARDATGVVASDTLPPTLAFVSTSDGGVESGGVVTWPAFALAAGASTTRTVVATVVDPLPNGTTAITNTASAADDGSHGADPDPGNNSGSDTDATDSAIDLTVAKDNGRTEVTPGATVTYAITVTNVGNQDAADAVLTDTIAPYTTFVSASDGGVESGGVVTWPGFAVVGGGTVTRTVTVLLDASVPAGVTSITNATNVSAAGDIDPSNDDAEDTDTVLAAPDLTISKDDGVTSAVRGDTLVYTLTVSNVGDQDATGVVVDDRLPAGTTYATASDGGSESGDVVSWPPFDLAAGASVTRSVTVTVDDPLPAGTVAFENLATVSDDGSNGPDPTPENNEAIDTDITGANLSITKDDNTAIAVPGTELTYVITVANAGPETVTEVTLLDTLPDALDEVAFEPVAGTYDATTGAWTGITLAPGGSVVLRVRGRVALDAAGDLVNEATVSPVGVADPDESDNTASDVDEITRQADLTLVKEAVGTFKPGGRGRYRFTVTNRGPSPASAVTIVDPLPEGLTLDAFSGEGWNCEPIRRVVVCRYGNELAPDASTRVTIDVLVSGSLTGGVVNTATVVGNGGDGPDPTPDDNTDKAAIEVDPPTSPGGGSGEPIPYTGADPFSLLLLGAFLVVAGTSLLGATRIVRRARS